MRQLGARVLSVRSTERLADNGVVNSVGACGDSYDNALAESINGLCKTELVRNKGPWRGLELATLESVDWVNHRHLFHELGCIRVKSRYLSSPGTRPPS